MKQTTRSTIYQLGKAHQNIFQNGIEEKQDNFFRIRSTTDRRRKYITTRKSCTCVGFSYRGHCSHITAIRVLSRATELNEDNIPNIFVMDWLRDKKFYTVTS